MTERTKEAIERIIRKSLVEQDVNMRMHAYPHVTTQAIVRDTCAALFALMEDGDG